jgi:hypothetical protein
LEKERSSLQGLAGDRAAEVEKFYREQELLRKELEQLSSALSKAEDEVTSTTLVSSS